MRNHSETELSANKQALLKIRELKQMLSDAQQNVCEPIAIVSMACRFPRRSKTPEEFWQSLLDQKDEVSEIPENRWDLEAFYDEDPEYPGKMYARHGVFLDNLDLMDPEFFGISPREANWVDPQQRLLMEVSWEAIERAGWQPDKIGEKAGVFVGWMHNDYQNEASDSFLNLNPYIATGAAGSFLSGRLAYYLGLQGPSLAIDTACSSSLVAIHLACQSLQRRDCDHALVGGVNAILSPTTNILTCKLKALSPNGHSRAFDAAADGYLRGEGCGVVALRRLSDAEVDGDPILGIIRGSALSHNGSGSGLTVPNPKAQEKVISEALQFAGIDPTEVDYLEAHGTGTELGDPIELQAAAAALAKNRSKSNPLLVGSVKTNIGHLEAAAGIAGLIKVLLSFENNLIPAQMNFDNPNPHIPWENLSIKIVSEHVDWPSSTKKKIAGLSAFGMSGTNAHIVLEAPTKTSALKPIKPKRLDKITTDKRVVDDYANILVLSGKNENALQTLAEDLGHFLESNTSVNLEDVSYTTCTGRTHLEHRAAIVVSDRNQAIEELRNLERSSKSDSLFQGNGRLKPKIAWQFTGQGSQYLGMAHELYENQQVFRTAIEDCDKLLQQWRNKSLKGVLFEDADLIHHTSWTQPCIFAVQMGLVKLLESWEMRPDVVLGHSVGQYAAACVAKMMSWEDGLRLISERGRLIGDLPAGGKMLAVFAPIERVNDAIGEFPDISLAAINGSHIVVSGYHEAIEAVKEKLDNDGVRSKLLKTSHAFHSNLMDPALEPFAAFAESVSFMPAQIPLVCNVTGKAIAADRMFDGEYWANHIREPVKFSDSIEELKRLKCEVVLELGPQAVLTAMARANWNANPAGLISCLQKDAHDNQSILKAVGQLYVQGATPDFESIYSQESFQRVVLPTYPFQRRRFWGPDKPRAFHAEFHTSHPILGGKVALAGISKETRYESFVEPDSPPWLPDHEVMGHVVMPGAAFVEMALVAGGEAELKDVIFEQPLRPISRTAIQTILSSDDHGQKTIEIFSSPDKDENWTKNFTCKFSDVTTSVPEKLDLEELKKKCKESIIPKQFYQKLEQLGLSYGSKFQTIDALNYSENEVFTRLSTSDNFQGYTIAPTLLDGALHSLAVGLIVENEDNLFLPVGIGRVAVFKSIQSVAWCYARWHKAEGNLRTASIDFINESGEIIAQIEELQVQQISRAALRQLSGTGAERLLHELEWQGFRLPAPTTKQTNWLVVSLGSEQNTLARNVGNELKAKGHQVSSLCLNSNSLLKQLSVAEFEMDGAKSDNWQELFDALSVESDGFPDGIAWILDDEISLSSSLGQIFEGQLPENSKSSYKGILNLVSTLSQRGIRRLECGLQLITSQAISVNKNEDCNPVQTQFWGLGRVIGAEHADFRCRLIDYQSDQSDSSVELAEILLTETKDNQIAIRNHQLLVPRMKQIVKRRSEVSNLLCNPESSYLITGGLGKLGRQAAKWLAERGAKQVVLVSRSVPDEETQEFLLSIESLGCQVVVHSASLSSPVDVRKLCERFGDDLLPLSGVIHAAGVLDDALLEQQNWERFEKVLSVKVVGATLLHEFTRSMQLDFFILYSSAASVLGSPGQSNYASANAYLDGLAWHRRSNGLPALSINWGPWTEGMADDKRILKRMALQGITPLSVSEAHSAIEKMMSSDLVQTTTIDVDWKRMASGMGGEVPATLSALASSRQNAKVGDSELVGKLKRLRGNEQKELLVKTLQNTLQQILSTSDLPETDRPLIEMGLDSLMAVEFGTDLQLILGDQFSINPTMLFDHPTIDAIAIHVLELIEEESEPPKAEDQGPTVTPTEKKIAEREDVAIIGMSCRFPGAQNLDEFWNNLLSNVDSVQEIPPDRWDVNRFYSADRKPGKMYSMEGGFIDDIADFDADFFNLTAQEACWIDPQHRMLLENSYRALEDAGISPHPIEDPNVGVFMGIMGQDYAFLPSLDDDEIIQAFQGAGLSHSAGVGRISYMFGFEGPSIAVDTASSSSLVALVQAMRSLQDGNCNMALAGGVNAILAPVNSLLMSKASFLSPDGRCKSFSSEANGFGRGEGCGVVVLKRLSDAKRDGDRIMAVVRGGAVVHNGFSGGITTPNGKSQSRMINDALKDAGIAPSQVQYLEAHGTGTEYGDPMELGAAASIYGKGRNPKSPLLVGSVKANISHLEAAGGVSGLIKTVLALHHGVIPSQIHFQKPSPHIPWERLPIKVVNEKTPWPESEQRIAGITALGLVGTNAHVILSSHELQTEEPIEEDVIDSKLNSDYEKSSNHLMVLSARSESALAEQVERYIDYLAKNPKVDFSDVCFTLAAGRRHYEHRIALYANSIELAHQKLLALAVNGSVNTINLPSKNGTSHLNGANGFDRPREIILQGISNTPFKLSWIFTGDSVTRPSLLRELYESQPVFQKLITDFEDRLKSHASKNGEEINQLVDLLSLKDEALPIGLHLFVLQAGIAKLWDYWGIEPEAVLGMGVGQYTAACVAGGLSYSDALILIYEREKIINQIQMLSLNEEQGLNEEDLPTELLELLDHFESIADGMNFYPPNLPLYCSLTGEEVPVHRSLGGSYWRKHCVERLASDKALKALSERKDNCLLQIGPSDSRRIDSGVESPHWLMSLSDQKNASDSMLEVLGELYVAGASPNFKHLYRDGCHKKISLPTYPFQKQRYWITEISKHLESEKVATST